VTYILVISLLEHCALQVQIYPSVVPNRVKTVTACRAFRAAAPNFLEQSAYVKAADSLNVVKRRLKCFMFDAAFK
jgi:hypothetical protein